MVTQNFEVIRTTAARLRFHLLVPETVTDWTTEFKAFSRAANGALVLAFTKAGAITSNADVANAATLGYFDVPLSAIDTAAFVNPTYEFTFRRTNVGFEDVLTAGMMTMLDAA